MELVTVFVHARLLALLAVILGTTTFVFISCGSGDEGVVEPDAAATAIPATESPAVTTGTVSRIPQRTVAAATPPPTPAPRAVRFRHGCATVIGR